MIKYREHNKAEFEIINAKLQRDYSKLEKKLEKKVITQPNYLDALTMGTEKNEKAMIASGLPFASFAAVGITSAAVGMVSLVPMVFETIGNNVTNAAESLRDFGEKAISFGVNTFKDSLPLLVLPVTIGGISLSIKVYKSLVEKKNNINLFNGEVIKLIDDVVDEKDDSTLDLAKDFMRRVDLSGNDSKININLLKYLTYHRLMLQEKESGTVNEEQVQEAYDNIILYLIMIKEKKGVSEEFKNNRFINILIDDYLEKERVNELLGEGKAR